jgi:hypothetical protein
MNPLIKHPQGDIYIRCGSEETLTSLKNTIPLNFFQNAQSRRLVIIMYKQRLAKVIHDLESLSSNLVEP